MLPCAHSCNCARPAAESQVNAAGALSAQGSAAAPHAFMQPSSKETSLPGNVSIKQEKKQASAGPAAGQAAPAAAAVPGPAAAVAASSTGSSAMDVLLMAAGGAGRAGNGESKPAAPVVSATVAQQGVFQGMRAPLNPMAHMLMPGMTAIPQQMIPNGMNPMQQQMAMGGMAGMMMAPGMIPGMAQRVTAGMGPAYGFNGSLGGMMNTMAPARKAPAAETAPVPSSTVRKTAGKKAGKKTPKRPLTAYTCFLSAVRPGLMADHPEKTFQNVAAMVGKMWKELDEAGRAPYRRRAQIDMDRFHREKQELNM